MAHLNELLDEALEETFPASDPIAIAVELAPETGPGVELRGPDSIANWVWTPDPMATDIQRLTDRQPPMNS
jgi:hypothetical protein